MWTNCLGAFWGRWGHFGDVGGHFGDVGDKLDKPHENLRITTSHNL